MAYIDAAFFKSYSPYSISDDELPFLIGRAQGIIDALTMDKIGGDAGLAQLTADTQTRIKKSVAAQVEMLYAQGGVDILNDMGDSSTTLGKFNTGKDISGGGPETLYGVPLAPLVRSYLRPTGLLFRGIQRHFPLVPLENRISLNDDDSY